MGRRTITKRRELNPEVRNEYLAGLIPLFVEKGMSVQSMDDIVQYLGIGKGTFYRHFHSRDELFDLFIDHLVTRIITPRKYMQDTSMPYEERFLITFAAILHEIEGIGYLLLVDLRDNLPIQWEKIRGTYLVWEDQLSAFFTEGVQRGYVNDINPSILAHMMILFFRELIRPEYLRSLEMTLAEAFVVTFKMQVRGIVKSPDFSVEAMEQRMRSDFPHMQFPELEVLFRNL